MDSKTNERRRASRRKIRLPVEVGFERGWTLDLSPSGVYFETSSAPAPGTPIRFTVVWKDPSPRPRRLECSGRIVRIDRRSGTMGVAVAVIASRWVEGPE